MRSVGSRRLDEIGFILLREPAVLAGHFVKLGAGIRRGERNLDAEHIEFLREADGVLDGLLCLDRQAENESAVNDHARPHGRTLVNRRISSMVTPFLMRSRMSRCRFRSRPGTGAGRSP